MTVTIKDIASRAGVSFSTVSKALRNSPLVTEKTRQKIVNIAEEMGYQPNNAARSLVSKKTWSIGVVWPSVERVTHNVLITKINDRLKQHAYTTLLSINQVSSAVEIFNRFQVDAILVFDDQKATFDHTFPNSRIPILYYGISGNYPFPTIDANRGKAIQLAVKHLKELGHERICYIGDLSGYDQFQKEKVSAFRDAMEELQLPLRHESIIRTDQLDIHDGYCAVKSVLTGARQPTAIIAGSFDLTRGILRAAKEMDIDIPQSVSLVSYDHIPQMSDLDISVTAVGVPLSRIADVTVQALLDITDEKEIPPAIYLQPELTVRASTAQWSSNP